MAIRDGVDVGVLGILRGGPLKPQSRHETLAKHLLGAAIGALAFDAGMADEHVLRVCQAAVDHRVVPIETAVGDLPFDLVDGGFGDNAKHQDLAIKMLRISVNELLKLGVDVREQCRVTLAACRAAFADAKVVDSVRELTQAIRGAS